MPVQRRSPAVLAYVAIAIAQLVVVLILGGGGISIPGVILAAVLFGYLYMGKPLAWWILATLNSIGLIILVVVVIADLLRSHSHVLWSHVLVLLVTTTAMELALLSPSMRRHVASRGMRLAPRGTRDESRD